MSLFVFGGIFYFIFISQNFKIKEVDIAGLETIQKNRISDVVENVLEHKKFGFLSFRNYFLFPSDKLKASLREQFPKIGSIKIKKINPDRLDIKIEERSAEGIWCASSCFYFSKEGIAFERAPKTAGSLILSIYKEYNDKRDDALGDIVLGRERIIFFQDARNIILRNFDFGVKRFIISSDGEFELETSEGWRIFLDKNKSPQYQLSNLKYLLDEEMGTRRRELEYVDLRLGNRIYYKFRE